MAAPGGTVTQERRGAVTILTLAYPERRNALATPVILALRDALGHAMADPACRAVVLTGADGHFSSGGDVSAMEGLDPDSLRRWLVDAQLVTRLLVAGGKPVVAAVEGWAAGAGLSLVASCDLVVASRAARFACSFNRIGLVADFGAALLLPARLGEARARHVMLTGDPFDAEAAERWGLVSQLAEPGRALADATALADRLARETAPLANAATKALLARDPLALDALLAAEADAQAALAASADFAEGIRAFREKRPPRFEGR